MQLISRDKIIGGAMNLASDAIKDMGIKDHEFVPGVGPETSPDGLFDMLDEMVGSDAIVAYGDWRDHSFDAYDLIVRFAEDNYSRIRHEKFGNGMYVVLMTKPLDV